MALFGSPLFGEEEFALTQLVINLSDSITPTDTIAKSVSITLQDTQNTVDSIADGVSLHALSDRISLYPGTIGTNFGMPMFGESLFAGTTRDDFAFFMPIKVLADSMTLSDFLAPFAVSKALSDTLTISAVLSFSAATILADVIFLSEVIHVEITNKALNDTIILNDWLQMKLNAAEPWSDN